MNQGEPIREWILMFSGFTQDLRDGRNSGMFDIFAMCLANARDGMCVLHPQEWHAETDGLARMVKELSVVNPIINVLGYSLGGGCGAQRMSRSLQNQGLRVKGQLLCDPVFRPEWLPNWLQTPRSFVHGVPLMTPVVRIPTNVDSCAYVYQREDHPQAHKVVALGDTPIQKTLVKGIGHKGIDNSADYRDLVTSVLFDE